jgi:mRNA interferase RelE/StbE
VSQRQVRILWTRTAVDALAALPRKVRRGILAKADELLGAGDPRQAHKPLTGPLAGYYTLKYSRYRALYRVDERVLDNGERVIQVTIRFVLAGVRKAGDKQDIYRIAEKLVRLGIIRRHE